MSRRVSKPAAALLAIVLSLTLSAPAAFAGDYRNRDVNPGIGTRVVRIVKHLAKKFGISTQEDVDFTSPAPPKP